MTTNLSEYEAKVAALERSNFDLKMQVYYLDKKYSDTKNNETIDTTNTTLESSNFKILELEEETEYSKRKIVELESEILQLQLLRENDAQEYQKSSKLINANQFPILEESRKRERDVAKAVAEHDAALIAKLQSELENLQLEHKKDIELIDECTARLAQQMEIVKLKEDEITNLKKVNAEIVQNMDILSDTARHQELLLSKSNYGDRL